MFYSFTAPSRYTQIWRKLHYSTSDKLNHHDSLIWRTFRSISTIWDRENFPFHPCIDGMIKTGTSVIFFKTLLCLGHWIEIWNRISLVTAPFPFWEKVRQQERDEEPKEYVQESCPWVREKALHHPIKRGRTRPLPRLSIFKIWDRKWRTSALNRFKRKSWRETKSILYPYLCSTRS